MAVMEDFHTEFRGQMTYMRLMTLGVLSISKLILTSAGDIKRLRVTKDSEEHYLRPALRYELPAYSANMKTVRSTEKYLRRTRFCDPQAPEVIAMAHALGAFEKPPMEYARCAFEFVKEQMPLEICPIDGVGDSLRRGTGTCFHLISVFIALCRTAGIKARYKMYATNMIKAWQGVLVDVDPLVKKWYDSLGYFLIEGEGEAFIDGRWVVAHVGPTAERQADAGLPITRLGEDALGIWFFARPGTIMHMEAIPAGLGFGSRFLHKLSPASMERVNVSVMKQEARGRAVIAKAGGPLAYDAQVRAAMGPQGPTVDLTPRPEITFGG